MLGLKRGTILLCKHEKEWDIEAQKTIEQLKHILGPVIRGIEYIGSTAIPSIKTKPIIGIVLETDNTEQMLALHTQPEAQGFYFFLTLRHRQEDNGFLPATVTMTESLACKRILSVC